MLQHHATPTDLTVQKLPMLSNTGERFLTAFVYVVYTQRVLSGDAMLSKLPIFSAYMLYVLSQVSPPEICVGFLTFYNHLAAECICSEVVLICRPDRPAAFTRRPAPLRNLARASSHLANLSPNGPGRSEPHGSVVTEGQVALKRGCTAGLWTSYMILLVSCLLLLPSSSPSSSITSWV